MRKLAIIIGANGDLGREYLKYFSGTSSYESVGFSRRETEDKIKNVRYLYCDLLDSEKLEKEVKQLDLEEFSEIALIHPVGKFAFEEYDEEFNEKIYDSNVLTFTNIASVLSEVAEINRKLIFCCFGSVSDKYNIPYWRSYTQSKKKLKEIVIELSENKNTRGVFVNTSTVASENKNQIRPFADNKYCLKPKKIVSSSINKIAFGESQFTELDIFEENPNFNKEYYSDHEAIYTKWQKEMGR